MLWRLILIKNPQELEHLPESSRLFFPAFEQLHQKPAISQIDIDEVIAKVQTMCWKMINSDLYWIGWASC
jgi:hypothetical protein